MKKLYLFLLSLIAVVAVQAQDWSQAYLQGGNVPGGWNVSGLRMEWVDNGVFQWTGRLTAGEFKFANYSDKWNPAFNAPAEGTVVELGTEYDVVYNQSNSGSNDFKFVLAEDGVYTVTLNIGAKKMKVEKAANYDLTQIYLIGDATTMGWQENDGIALTKVEGTDATFEYTGHLNPGKFRFKNQKEGWYPGFNSGILNEPVNSGETYPLVFHKTSDGAWDWSFVVADAGEYKITVDLAALTMSVEKSGATEYYLIGTAIPDGSAKLEAAPTGVAHNYIYTGKLQEGTLKLSTTADGSEGSYFYVLPADSQNKDITFASAMAFTTDAAAEGWSVGTPNDYYRLKINLVDNTISAETVTSKIVELYMVGGATEIGWDAENALPFTQDEVNPFVFTWEGKLTSDGTATDNSAFKIIGEKSWSGTTFNAVSDWAPVLEATTYLQDGNKENPQRDYKWIVDAEKQGDYKITVDLLKESFKAEYKGDGSGVASAEAESVAVYAVDGTVYVDAASDVLNARVYNLAGVEVASARGGNSVAVASGLAKGVYVVTVETAAKTVSQKLIVR